MLSVADTQQPPQKL